jgi:signal transduction histidine kinase
MSKGPFLQPPVPTPGDETSRVAPRPSGVAPVGDAEGEEAPSGVLPGPGQAVDADARAGSASLEQRMMQADKLATFGQIAAGLVHELNNPLTSILAYTDYLLRKAEGGQAYDAQDLERLRRIGQSAERILRFSRELVAYARPSRGRVEPVHVHAAIDQAVAFCEHVLSGARVQVVRHYGDEVQTVEGASEQLVQVFVNLLTNACQAMKPSGGSVVITTSRPAGPVERVIVVVEDDGSGIAPDDLPQIFVPFFTTRDDKQGTGLGLSIVKSIIDGHEGDIRVDSQVGRGTRFVIELPVASVRRAR